VLPCPDAVSPTPAARGTNYHILGRKSWVDLIRNIDNRAQQFLSEEIRCDQNRPNLIFQKLQKTGNF
jgi:hypothetical protein